MVNRRGCDKRRHPSSKRALQVALVRKETPRLCRGDGYCNFIVSSIAGRIPVSDRIRHRN
jgi:hypothetical protein